MINWDEKTELQKVISIFEYDIKVALDNALQYKYLLKLFNDNFEFVNKAPVFFSRTISSCMYSLIMRSARIFDESKDSYGFKKILNKIEMNYSKDKNMLNVISVIKNEYAGYEYIFNNIRILRDKIYAHNDRKMYRNGDCYSEEEAIDSFNHDDFEKVLRWAFNACCSIEKAYGDDVFPYNELVNDVINLVNK